MSINREKESIFCYMLCVDHLLYVTSCFAMFLYYVFSQCYVMIIQCKIQCFAMYCNVSYGVVIFKNGSEFSQNFIFLKNNDIAKTSRNISSQCSTMFLRCLFRCFFIVTIYRPRHCRAIAVSHRKTSEKT